MKLKSCKKLSIIKWISCPRTLADSYLVCNIFSVTDFLYMKIFLFHKRTTFYVCDMMRQKINFAFFSTKSCQPFESFHIQGWQLTETEMWKCVEIFYLLLTRVPPGLCRTISCFNSISNIKIKIKLTDTALRNLCIKDNYLVII